MHTVRASWARRLLTSFAAGLALAALAGCGGGASDKATVSGKVIYKSAPVPAGTLILAPASGDPYRINLKPDGTFSVAGVVPGQMSVGIDTSGVPDANNLPRSATKPSSEELSNMLPKKVEIPAKYKDPKTSGLTWDVKPGKNTNDFNLTD